MCELGGATNAARRYEGGGKIGWALPSRDELNAALLLHEPGRN